MTNMYAWVSWFRELAARIAEGGERGLIERVTDKDTKWPAKEPAILKYGDENIDPLSFLNYISSSHKAMELVDGVFEVESNLPQKGDWEGVFPTIRATKALLHDRQNFDPERRWDLFRQAQPDRPRIEADTFNTVLQSPDVGIFNLTNALCLTNPHEFLPISEPGVRVGRLVSALSELRYKMEDFTLSTYNAIIRQARTAFPGCRLHEIARFLYLQGGEKSELVSEKSAFFHISTNVFADGHDRWSEFEQSNSVFVGGNPPQRRYPLTKPKRGDVMLVRFGRTKGHGIGVVLENGYKKVGGFSKEARIHVLWINRTSVALPGQTAEDGMGYALPEKATFSAFAGSAYGPTLQSLKELGVRMKPPPDPPVDDTVTHPLNQILYGPPGTGKTWDTVAHAVAIIDGRRTEKVLTDDRGMLKARFDAYRDAGQVEMVTFHQNYAYEDFIEGIRPVLGDGDSAGLGFELSRGTLRRIADAAERNRQACAASGDDFPDVEELVQAFGEHVEASPEKVRLSEKAGGDGLYIDRVGRNGEGDVVRFKLGGRTSQYLFKRVVLRDYRSFYEGRIRSFKDIKPVRSARGSWMGQASYFFMLFEAMRAFHDQHPELAKKEAVKRKNFVLILDEINRGNIARIFGELITLVEESRRIGHPDETKVVLPHSKEEFGVPKNLYLIGTMNTADRSIALLDTALRRRFEFVEMMPDSDHPDIATDIEGVNLRRLLKAMNERIRFLRDREHQIGHTYFLQVSDLEGLRRVFQNRILPLLQEYFYDDWAKIAAVLGDNGFVKSVECPQELAGGRLVERGAKSYELLRFDKRRWRKPASYRKIYGEEPAENRGDGDTAKKTDGADEK